MNSGAVGAITAAIVVPLVFRKVLKPGAIKEGGRTILRYNRFFKITTLFSPALPLVPVYFLLFRLSDPYWVAISVLTVIGLLFAAVAVEVWFVEIAYDAEHIYTRSPWREARTIRWTSINGLRFVASMSWFEVSTTNRGPIRIPNLINGCTEMIEEVKRRLGTTGGKQ